MNVIDLVRLPARYKPWRPRHLSLVWDSVRGTAAPAQPHAAHLGAAVDWLCRAQDMRDGHPDAGGVSAGWSFEDGWLPSYPETTGYIIETMLAAATALGRPELVARAARMIDWELSIQLDDGAFPGHFGEPGSRPVIFNTGQIMHGMVAGATQLQCNDCLEAAVRAGHWLARQQDDDGCWRRFEHHDTPHVYNTRATWALLATGLIAGEPRLVQAARKNLDWALTQQTASGWFATNAFVPWKSPFTHTIAYAIRGFLESGVLLGDERYVTAALKAGRGIAAVQRADGWLAGTYLDGWVADASYACLTGVAQMSLNWTRLAQATGADDLRAHARSALAYLKTTHRLDHPDPAVRGGIAGSAPIWGDYSRFEYPNWAAKFFADALMMDMLDIAVPPVPAVAQVPVSAAMAGLPAGAAGG
ncbi:MAG: terpene cyclase/mutase family protein [Burkholderiales bacterium]|nr:terpene cyclase/mutase family protein [Burkholderiales bacterium]